MKTLIICYSAHNGNTEKVAQAMSKVLDAQILKPMEVDSNSLEQYDLIGFGSGIYNFIHHTSLLAFVDRLPAMNKNAFIFSTKAMFPQDFCHRTLKKKLLAKGFMIIGEFSCKGLVTFGPAKLFGGINKGRPNELDLENAQAFARSLE